jgi:hypothetical protein
MPSPRKKAEDEAYLKSMAALDQQTLPFAELAQVVDVPRLAEVPKVCPACQAERKVARGGWTLTVGDIIQCGACGERFAVPREHFERYLKALHEAYKAPVVTVRRNGPRSRGAG